MKKPETTHKTMPEPRKEKNTLLHAATLLLVAAFSLSLHSGFILFKASAETEEKLRFTDQPLETGACGVPPANLVIVAATGPCGTNTPASGGHDRAPHQPSPFAILGHTSLTGDVPPLPAVPVPIERLVANRKGGAPPASACDAMIC